MYKKKAIKKKPRRTPLDKHECIYTPKDKTTTL